MFLSLAVMGIMGAIMISIGLPFPQRFISFVDVIGVSVSLILLSSIYLPFYYKFGYIKSRFFNVIMFMLFFFAPTYLAQYFKEHLEKEVFIRWTHILQTTPDWIFAAGGIVLGLLVMSVSYIISATVYRSREF
jgi:hypothetical protein